MEGFIPSCGGMPVLRAIVLVLLLLAPVPMAGASCITAPGTAVCDVNEDNVPESATVAPAGAAYAILLTSESGRTLLLGAGGVAAVSCIERGNNGACDDTRVTLRSVGLAADFLSTNEGTGTRATSSLGVLFAEARQGCPPDRAPGTPCSPTPPTSVVVFVPPVGSGGSVVVRGGVVQICPAIQGGSFCTGTST